MARCWEGHLHGPPGWLGGAVAGELRAFHLRDGRLHVEPAEFGDTALAGAQAVLTVLQAELERSAGLPAPIGPRAPGGGGGRADPAARPRSRRSATSWRRSG